MLTFDCAIQDNMSLQHAHSNCIIPHKAGYAKEQSASTPAATFTASTGAGTSSNVGLDPIPPKLALSAGGITGSGIPAVTEPCPCRLC